MIYPAENLKIDFDFEWAAVGIGPYDSIDRLYDKLKFEAQQQRKPGCGKHPGGY